jgi:flavodoxin
LLILSTTKEVFVKCKNSSSEDKRNSPKFTRKCMYNRLIYLVITLFLLIPICLSAGDSVDERSLIIYYSRTGKTKLVSEKLQENLDADLLEIKDPKDRSGAWGYIKSSMDAFSHRHTPIEPEKIDLSSYSFIIIATPIWSWNLSTPILTLFEKNRFDGKKVVLITTANIHIMKYEQYGDDASFIKRFLRDYLRGKREVAVSEVKNLGGEFIGHYHIATKEMTDKEIIDETMKCIDYAKKVISASH